MTHWVFLRGLAREARHWGDFPAVFRQTVRAEKITLQDLAGNGAFNAQRSATSVRAMVGFVRQQLADAGVEPPHQVLAMSLGAMVATEWAAQYPQEVSRLVLINTSMRPLSNTVERLRPNNWPTLAAMAVRWRNAGFAERSVFRLTCNRLDTLAADEASWLHIRGTAPVNATNVALQLIAAARYRVGPLAPLCPVLVLSSSCDALVNPVCSHHLASAWKVEHRQHAWAGHDLPHDDAQWVCQQVASWLELDAPL
jgi:pimeloyl-ACP methyl ester carboxylesterase